MTQKRGNSYIITFIKGLCRENGAHFLGQKNYTYSRKNY